MYFSETDPKSNSVCTVKHVLLSDITILKFIHDITLPQYPVADYIILPNFTIHITVRPPA